MFEYSKSLQICRLPHMVSKLLHSESSKIVGKNTNPLTAINMHKYYVTNNLDTKPIILKDLVGNGPKFDLLCHLTSRHEFDDVQHPPNFC